MCPTLQALTNDPRGLRNDIRFWVDPYGEEMYTGQSTKETDMKLEYDVGPPGSGKNYQAKTVEDVKATVVKNIDTMIASIAEKRDTEKSHRRWLSKNEDTGMMKVSVRYGLKALFFDERMNEKNPCSIVPNEAAAIKVFKIVKKATEDGTLDAAYENLRDRMKRGPLTEEEKADRKAKRDAKGK